MSDEKQWMVTVKGEINGDSDAGERVLSQINRPNATWHATKEEAEAKADEVLDAAAAAGPTLRWEALGTRLQITVTDRSRYRVAPPAEGFRKTRMPSGGG